MFEILIAISASKECKFPRFTEVLILRYVMIDHKAVLNMQHILLFILFYMHTIIIFRFQFPDQFLCIIKLDFVLQGQNKALISETEALTKE